MGGPHRQPAPGSGRVRALPRTGRLAGVVPGEPVVLVARSNAGVFMPDPGRAGRAGLAGTIRPNECVRERVLHGGK